MLSPIALINLNGLVSVLDLPTDTSLEFPFVFTIYISVPDSNSERYVVFPLESRV